MTNDRVSCGFTFLGRLARRAIVVAGFSALACGTSAPDEAIAEADMTLLRCGTELGVAPLDSSCGHALVGPFGDPDGNGAAATPVLASSTIDFAAATPRLTTPRVLYRVALPGAPGSNRAAVKFTPGTSQDYSLSSDVGAPLSVLRPDGSAVSAILQQDVNAECGAVRARLGAVPGATLTALGVYPLAAGVTYRIVIGPSSSSSLNLLIDEPNDYLNVYYADADTDGYGDFNRPAVSECTAPAGFTSNDTDCNDQNAAIHPAAAEVVDGIDNDCDGSVDTGPTGDLEMVSAGLRAPGVRRLLVGQSTTVVLEQVINNRGVQTVDAVVTRTASGTGPASIAPLSSSEAVNDMPSLRRRTLSTSYTVSCSALGSASFTITASIQPAAGSPPDPDLMNNTRQTTFAVDCIACVHAVESLVVADRSRITSADVFGGRYFELGSDSATATVAGNVRVDGNAFLRSTARVEGNLTLSGAMAIQGPFVVTGMLREHTPVVVPPVLTFGFRFGTAAFFVPEQGTASFAPGSYGAGLVDFDGTANLRSGTYDFGSLEFRPGTTVNFDTSGGDVFVNSQDGLSFGDRTRLLVTGGGKVAFYTNATGVVRVGTDVQLNAAVSAPRATLQVFSRTTINGCTSANRLAYEPDVVQTANGIAVGLPGSLPPPALTCTDGLRNGNEVGIDCGGSCPNSCATCSDGIKNGSETGVDCGGTCIACPTCNQATYQAETMFHSTGVAVTGGWNIRTNGYVSTQHNFSAGPSRVVVSAKGTVAQNVWPHMVVRVAGVTIGEASVTSTNWANYTFNFTATAGSKEIRVTFDNNLVAPPQDRDLLVDSVAVTCPPPAPAISATLPVTSNWATGYCVNVAVANNGTAPSTTWSVVVNTRQSTISSSWNANFSGASGLVTVTPTWNGAVQPGQTITSAGFCANRNPGTSNLPTVVSASGS